MCRHTGIRTASAAGIMIGLCTWRATIPRPSFALLRRHRCPVADVRAGPTCENGRTETLRAFRQDRRRIESGPGDGRAASAPAVRSAEVQLATSHHRRVSMARTGSIHPTACAGAASVRAVPRRTWSDCQVAGRSGTHASRRWTVSSKNSSKWRRPLVASQERESRRTAQQRKSEREVVVTRAFDGPARPVFQAWFKPESLKNGGAPLHGHDTLLVRDGSAHRRHVPHGVRRRSCGEGLVGYGSTVHTVHILEAQHSP